MNDKKSTCKTGLKKNVINKDIFKRELELCKNLSKENGGSCSWGACAKCGVLPLLYKLHKGVLFEKPKEIKNIKKILF